MASTPSVKGKAGAKKKTGAGPFAYFREAREEISKVVWPTRKELRRHTVIVIVISLAVALFLGLLDVLLKRGLQYIV